MSEFDKICKELKDSGFTVDIINERIAEIATIVYSSKVNHLQAELIKKDEQLKEANEVIDFYGDRATWDYGKSGCGQTTAIRSSDWEDLPYVPEFADQTYIDLHKPTRDYGGKRAREYKKKWKGEKAP